MTVTAALLAVKMLCQAQEPHPGDDIFTQWRYTLFHSRTMGDLPLPNYWQKLDLGKNARSEWFVGPEGLIFAFFPIEKNKTDEFWNTLRSFDRITHVLAKEPGRGDGVNWTNRLYEVTAKPFKGFRLGLVCISEGKSSSIAIVVKFPIAVADPQQTILHGAEHDLREIAGLIASLETGRRLDESVRPNSSDPLIVALLGAVVQPKPPSPSLDRQQAVRSVPTGPRPNDAADGPWVSRVLALTAGNAANAGFSDGFQLVTGLVIKLSYSGDDEYAMRVHMTEAKELALSAYDQLAEKYGLDRAIYRAYRQGWSDGFERNASTLSVSTNR